MRGNTVLKWREKTPLHPPPHYIPWILYCGTRKRLLWYTMTFDFGWDLELEHWSSGSRFAMLCVVILNKVLPTSDTNPCAMLDEIMVCGTWKTFIKYSKIFRAATLCNFHFSEKWSILVFVLFNSSLYLVYKGILLVQWQ